VHLVTGLSASVVSMDIFCFGCFKRMNLVQMFEQVIGNPAVKKREDLKK
jgi:hypothetical protein